MKYFIDDDHWDIAGYAIEKKNLLPRFDKKTANFLKKHSFHDGMVKKISVVNKEDGNKKDPTTIKMVIKQYNNGSLFQIKWTKVQKF